jgi:hypothetical protein
MTEPETSQAEILAKVREEGENLDWSSSWTDRDSGETKKLHTSEMVYLIEAQQKRIEELEAQNAKLREQLKKDDIAFSWYATGDNPSIAQEAREDLAPFLPKS